METRFSHLLQPIRDLAQNWDIDIASQLEDYLSELDQLVVSFDGGATTMNFAEAALLIQGSACIYSRKVEYFYALVYESLELLASKRKQAHGPSVDKMGRDKDVTGFDKQVEEFLPLDDIKESNKVDLNEKGQKKEIDLILRTPMSLIPYRDDEKEDCALISPTGEVIGNRKDFKMNTSIFHESGAALLDLGHIENVDRIYMESRRMSKTGLTCAQTGLLSENVDMAEPHEMDKQDVVASADDDMDGGFNEFGDHSVDYGIPEVEEVEQKVDRMTRQRAERKTISSLHYVADKVDPWQLLDPHDPSGDPQKPFKKGKPYRIPPHLVDAPMTAKGKKRKRKDPVSKQPPLDSLWEFCRKTFYSSESRLPKNFLKAPAFIEFQDLFWFEQKRRDQRQRKEKRMLTRLLGDWQQFFPSEHMTEQEDAKEQENEDCDECGWDGGDDAGSFAGYEAGGEPIEPLHVSKSAIVQDYEDLVKKHVQLQLLVAQQYAQETELSKRVRNWEEMIAPILAREENYNVFDIHSYGELILCQLEQLGVQETGSPDSPVPFCKLTRERKPYEVCRLLLASLQLANSENIEIMDPGEATASSTMDSISVRLRSKEMTHKRFDTYRVPSFEKTFSI